MKTTILPMKSKGIILMFNIHEQLISVAMNIPAVIVYKLNWEGAFCHNNSLFCVNKVLSWEGPQYYFINPPTLMWQVQYMTRIIILLCYINEPKIVCLSYSLGYFFTTGWNPLLWKAYQYQIQISILQIISEIVLQNRC